MPKKYLLVLLVFLPAVTTSSAQQESTFTSQTNLVEVPTLVLDHDGKIVEGLHATDFIVEDNGIEQKVQLSDDSDVHAISLMIAIQCGGRASREYGRISTLASMLDPVLAGPNVEAAVLFFDSKLNLIQDFSNNSETVENSVKELPSGDRGAAILDASAYSARLLARRPPERQKVLLLISETRDHGSKFTKLDDLVPLIGGNNISGLHQIRVRLRDPKPGERLLFRTSYWVAKNESDR